MAIQLLSFWSRLHNITHNKIYAGEFSHVYEGKLQKTVEGARFSITDSGPVSVKRETVKQTVKVAVKTLKGTNSLV